jgi:formate dehydrogenase maturation protein FdhE
VELKDARPLYGPCPICGGDPSALMIMDSIIVVGCQNKDCHYYNKAFSPSSWQAEKEAVDSWMIA